jgi:ribosomal protein L37AE/L43A
VKGEGRLVCPDCGRKGVTLRLGSEDWFVCRYCDWSACAQGNDRMDVERRSDLARFNPGREGECRVFV